MVPPSLSAESAAPGRLGVVLVPAWYPSPAQPVLGTFIREQARAIARFNDVAVVCFDDRPLHGRSLYTVTEEADPDGLPTLRVAQRWWGSKGLPVRLAALQAALRRLAAHGFHADVLHAHVFHAGLATVALGRLRGLPVVVSENYTGFPKGTVQGAERLAARLTFEGADLACPASEDLCRHIQRLGIHADFRVVPNTVDTSLFSAKESVAPGPATRLITVALMDRKKGLEHLLDALALLGDEQVTLDLVGDGPSRPSLEARVRQLGLERRVTFHGVKAKPEVAGLLREADVFVLPSLWENLPNVIIEALASGLPVVATSVGGVPEMIDESTGALAPPADPPALASALADVIRCRAEFDPACLAATADRLYGFDAVGREWDGIYRELLPGGRRRRRRRAHRRR